MLGQDVMRAAGDRGVGLAHAELDVTDAGAVSDALRGATVINCAGYTDVDGAEADPEAAHELNERGARNVAEAAARVIYVSTDYVFDGTKPTAYVESDPVNPLSAYGRSKLAGERATLTASPQSVIVRTSWLFGAGGHNFVETMLRLGEDGARLNVVDDQVGCPTFTGHLGEALVGLAEGHEHGFLHVGGYRRVLVVRVRAGDLRAGGGRTSTCTRAPPPSSRARRRGRRIQRLRASAARPSCPPGRRGSTRYLGVRGVRLLVTGGAGFIGSTYVRLHRARPRHRGARQAHLRRPPRRTCRATRSSWWAGSRTAMSVTQVADGVDAIVNFAAESHVDRSIADQDVFARTHVIGTGVLLDAARELGVPRYLQVSTDEVYGSIQDGSFTETSPLDPSSPYSATKAAGDLLVSAHHHTYGTEAVICRGSNNYGPRQYPEKLIPLSILNAMHDDPLPVYGDGRQVRNWLYVEDFCRGIHAVLEGGRPGEAYNVGGPDECENIDVVRRILELTGRDESLIEHVTDRRATTGATRSARTSSARARLGGPGALRRGPRPDRRLVPRQRGVVAADPLRRVPRLLREALRAGLGLAVD